MKKAFFFDRDGIVNKRKIGGYIIMPEEFVFNEPFIEIFRIISKSWMTIVVSNQQGIGKGLMTHDDLRKIHELMQTKLKERTGSCFDDIFYCPDLDGTGSTHRKPAPGMILDAAQKWDINLGNSYIMGDSISDHEAGKAAGLNTILVGEHDENIVGDADYIFKNLEETSEFINKHFS